MTYADIIVDISHENIDKTFQYRIPEDLQASVKIGSKVNIPFGNRKGMTGYVVGLSCVPKIEEGRIKDIIGLAPHGIDIDSRMLELAAWIKTNYGGTMNETLKTVLPVKKSVRPAVKTEIALACDRIRAEEVLNESIKKHFVAKARLISQLLENDMLPKDLISTKLNISAATVNSLEKQGIVEVRSEKIDRNKRFNEPGKSVPVKLNDEQEAAASRVINDMKAGKRGTYLVFGVTGSGKTEVYMEIIDHVVKSGKQVIVLIPEIALTFQTVLRFSKRFGDRVAYFNSKLSPGERYDQYLKAKEGSIDIMIGPRSALFTPFENPGLIVIDEEHEGAYKSEGVPKYHAREVAEEICRMTGASLVLGSATPSLESYNKTQKGEYTLLKLTKRAKEAALPEVEIVDLREELKNKNRTIFSLRLVSLMEDRLKKREQIMLFLNRRGYSGFVSCRSCGEAVKCPHCSVSLTQHRDGYLRCHYCGYETPMPKKCPKCGSPYIAAFGTGTQKIEESVKKLFPSARTLRMDADTTKDKESYEKILSSFANEEADILIGTQMIVKGHDFPHVTLVGILAADMSLHATDYRAAEKTFQLLAQAAGRAGRANLKGNVVIQTYKPEHYAIVTAADQDYLSFYEQEILYRKNLCYPPVGHIMALLFSGRDEDKCCAAIKGLTAKIIDKFKTLVDNKEIVRIGPAPAGISKINDNYRYVVYFKAQEYSYLTDICAEVEKYRDEIKEAGLSCQTDFDPMTGY
jgi:primosomal protein N' (replication factor Y)